MAEGKEKYDSALLAILQNEGKVAPFLDVVLGFLYRRTDYFRVMKTENDRLGFPPGVAQKLLLNIYKQYEALSKEDSARLEELRKAKTEAAVRVDEHKEGLSRRPTASKAPDDVHQDGKVPMEAASKSPSTSITEGSDQVARPMETDSSSEPTKAVVQPQPESSEDKDEDEQPEDPEKARERRQLQANPLTYNGAEREHYLWSQIITEVDVRVKVPQHIIKGKQVRVDIQKKHIRVSHLDKDNSWCGIIDSDLVWEINREESVWTLSPGEFVHINLEKREERWWEAVFVEEPKINTRKIDCSRPMTDLDDEAQAKIEEMMYNQRQKQLGLPQSHEQKTHEMLRKAWDAEGSPFKGQPFDPSRFSVDSSGIANFNPS